MTGNSDRASNDYDRYNPKHYDIDALSLHSGRTGMSGNTFNTSHKSSNQKHKSSLNSDRSDFCDSPGDASETDLYSRGPGAGAIEGGDSSPVTYLKKGGYRDAQAVT